MSILSKQLQREASTYHNNKGIFEKSASSNALAVASHYVGQEGEGETGMSSVLLVTHLRHILHSLAIMGCVFEGEIDTAPAGLFANCPFVVSACSRDSISGDSSWNSSSGIYTLLTVDGFFDVIAQGRERSRGK